MTLEAIVLYVSLSVCLLSLLISAEAGKHTTPKGKGCPQGCSTCSTFNGCITCRPQYFLLLYRNNMRHVGICTHTCPTGYYPTRGLDISRCLKCRVDNCELCFARTFCAKCTTGFYTHRGKCLAHCPTGMYAEKSTGDCKPILDCEVSQWNNWTACMREGKTCGRKWGEQVRTRDVSTFSSREGLPCPILLESRKCLIAPRFCPEPTKLPDESMDGSRRKKKKNKKARRRQHKRRRKTKNNKVPDTDERTSAQRDRKRSRDKSRQRTKSTSLS